MTIILLIDGETHGFSSHKAVVDFLREHYKNNYHEKKKQIQENEG